MGQVIMTGNRVTVETIQTVLWYGNGNNEDLPAMWVSPAIWINSPSRFGEINNMAEKQQWIGAKSRRKSGTIVVLGAPPNQKGLA